MPSSRNDEFMCPVCGFRGLSEPPYDEYHCASFEICPCCGTEFGYDDANKSFDQLRAAWIAAGMLWHSRSTPPSDGWDGHAQLAQAGLAGRG
jgi:hypothetical protein